MLLIKILFVIGFCVAITTFIIIAHIMIAIKSAVISQIDDEDAIVHFTTSSNIALLRIAVDIYNDIVRIEPFDTLFILPILSITHHKRVQESFRELAIDFINLGAITVEGDTKDA